MIPAGVGIAACDEQVGDSTNRSVRLAGEGKHELSVGIGGDLVEHRQPRRTARRGVVAADPVAVNRACKRILGGKASSRQRREVAPLVEESFEHAGCITRADDLRAVDAVKGCVACPRPVDCRPGLCLDVVGEAVGVCVGVSPHDRVATDAKRRCLFGGCGVVEIVEVGAIEIETALGPTGIEVAADDPFAVEVRGRGQRDPSRRPLDRRRS